MERRSGRRDRPKKPTKGSPASDDDAFASSSDEEAPPARLDFSSSTSSLSSSASKTGVCPAYRLSFAAHGLRKRKDRLTTLFSPPDAYLALYLDNKPLWKTEVVRHSTEPSWESFVLYRDRIGHGDISEKVIRLEVWDWRDGVVHLVGQTSVAFHVLITQGFEAPLINPKRKMTSFRLLGKYKDSGKVRLASVVEERDLHWNGEPPLGYEMVIRGDKLDAKDISKVNSSHSFLLFKTAQGVVHRTEVVKGTVQPQWQPILLELDQVGPLGKYFYAWRRKQILYPSPGIEQEQPWLDEYIVIECWNWQANGRHELIGVSPVLCLRDFLACTRYQFALINKEKKEREVPVLSDFSKEFTGMSVRVPYRHSGILYVDSISVVPEDRDNPKLIPEAFILDVSATKLDNRGLTKAIISAPNPFLRIRTGEWGGGRVIFQTEHDIKTEEPHWKPFALTVSDCGGLRQNIVIQCLNFLPSGEEELIGQFEASLVELTSGKLDVFYFVNPTKIDWIGYSHSGKLKICYFRPISAQEADEFVEGYRVTLAPIQLAPPSLFPHARMPYGCYVKIWNIEEVDGEVESILVAETEVITPESPRQDRWRPLVFDIGKVPTLDTPLSFDVWWRNHKEEEMDLLLGTFQATLRQFINYSKSPQFALRPPRDAQQLPFSSTRGEENPVRIDRHGEDAYEEVHLAEQQSPDSTSSALAKVNYIDFSRKGKERDGSEDKESTSRATKKGKKAVKDSDNVKNQGSATSLGVLRRKTESSLGRSQTPTKKTALTDSDARRRIGQVAVREFWVVGVSEVDLTPLRKKKASKRAKDENGGDRVLNYAKTITHNLIPLMKTNNKTGSERGLTESTATVDRSHDDPDTPLSERTAKSGGKSWSLASMMMTKNHSKDRRVKASPSSRRRRGKKPQLDHDDADIELIEQSRESDDENEGQRPPDPLLPAGPPQDHSSEDSSDNEEDQQAHHDEEASSSSSGEEGDAGRILAHGVRQAA